MSVFYFSVMLSINYWIACADDSVSENVTLTTMKVWPSVWPKPTNSDQYIPEEISTSAINNSLFPLLNDTRRRGRDLESPYDGNRIEWGWDKWCQLQPRMGTCRMQQKFFYYQARTDSCREFTYTGCNGNQNKFSSRADCEQFCKGYGSILESKSLSQYESCSLQPNPGNCLGYMTRYYYDINLGKCKPFIFGGCGGNPNRFLDMQTCLQRCGAVFSYKTKN